MIQFTRWTIILSINSLVVTLLYILIPRGFLINTILNFIILVVIWRFVDWNIQSDKDLGIKPGIELF